MGRSQRHLREIQGIDSAGEVDVGNPAAMPTFASTPAITGTPTVGETLTLDPPVVNSTTPVVTTFQWEADGTAIADAVASTYVLVSGDVGKQITCEVTASNMAGTVTGTSNSIGPVVSGV